MYKLRLNIDSVPAQLLKTGSLHPLIPHLFSGYVFYYTTNLSALIFGQNRPEMQSRRSLK